jgi:hypothetical protein
LRNRLITILGLGIVGTAVAWAIQRLTRDCREVVPDCWGNPIMDCASPQVECSNRPELFFVWLLPFVLVAIYWYAPQLRRLYDEHRLPFIAVVVVLATLIAWPFFHLTPSDADITESGRTILGPD